MLDDGVLDPDVFNLVFEWCEGLIPARPIISIKKDLNHAVRRVRAVSRGVFIATKKRLYERWDGMKEAM